MKKSSKEEYVPRRISLKEWEKHSEERKKKAAFVKNLFDLSFLKDRKGPSYCTDEAIEKQKKYLASLKPKHKRET